MTHPSGGRRQRALTQVSDLLRYTLLGDLILGHVAPRRMRQAAWRDGFAFALGSGRRNWWLALIREHCDGNDAGHALRARSAVPGLRGPIGVLRRSDVQPGSGPDEAADLAGERR